MSVHEFTVWSKNSEIGAEIVDDFLSAMSQVCHIVLGLQPESKSVERTVVQTWMARERRAGFQPGQIWYVVAQQWWSDWERWIHYEAPPMLEFSRPMHSRQSSTLSDSGPITASSPLAKRWSKDQQNSQVKQYRVVSVSFVSD